MWYKSGTVSLTNGSTTVVGSGTAWIAGAAVGEGFIGPDGKTYEIANIASNTSLTLGTAYQGSTASTQAYQIIPSQSYIRDLASQAAVLISDYGTGKFTDGTLAQPGIRFTLDENTGIRRVAADTLALVVNGADKVTVSTSGVSGINKTDVGLPNVDNTSDSAKPVSTATQTALNLKANIASPTFTGTVAGITSTMVGLGNVNNTADSAKPVSTAQQTALDLKANIASPTFTGTVSGITKAMVGLGNVDNTSNATERAATATLTNKTIDLTSNTLVATSAQLAAAITDETGSGSVVFSVSPALTGTPTAPTAAAATNTTQLATTAFVGAATTAERTAVATLTNKTLTSPVLTTQFVDVTTNNLPTVRPTLNLDFANSQTVDPRITFTRSQTSDNVTRINSRGLIERVQANVPRIDYDPVTLACKGLLVEEARSNVCLHSEDFSNAAWNVKTNISVTTNSTVAPDGAITADTLTATAANGVITQGYVTTAVPWTFSVFIKRKTGSGDVSITMDGTTFVAQSINSTSWTRCVVTQTGVAGTSNFGIRISASGDEVYAWGGQAE